MLLSDADNAMPAFAKSAGRWNTPTEQIITNITLHGYYSDTSLRYHTWQASGRGIDNDIVRFCIETGRIYESAYHHNAVFVGMDQQGKPQYAALRGINTDFIGEANGSNKNYSFLILAEKMSDKVHVFESAIDLLS